MNRITATVKEVVELETPLLKKSEASKYLRVSIPTLDRLIAEKAIEYIKVGQLVFFTKSGLNEFLTDHTVFPQSVNPGKQVSIFTT